MSGIKSFITGKPSNGSSSSSKNRDIIAEYMREIDDFLNHVEGKSFTMFQRRDDPLGDILGFSKHMYKERSKIEHNLSMANRELDKREETMMAMQKEIDRLEHERGKLQWEKDDGATKAEEAELRMTKQHSADMKEVQNRYEDRLAKEKKQHEKDMAKLVGQLLVSQRDDQGWPDDKMGIKFKELQRLMEGVTAPRNREFLVPKGKQFPGHLDEEGFLGQVGNEKSHFLLKCRLWDVMREQFFSAPFGFGVLGPRNEQRELWEMYRAWRKLFDGEGVASSPTREDYAIFAQDPQANNWRSTTFQYINIALTDPSQSTSPISLLNTTNYNTTISRITSILSSVASLSSSSIRPEILTQVKQMVSLGRDIALQFGIQPAQMQLLVPAKGERIKIGEWYHDCEDGDSFKGKMHDVLLVTAPGLRKVGDGKGDLGSERAMVPAEIYPVETDN